MFGGQQDTRDGAWSGSLLEGPLGGNRRSQPPNERGNEGADRGGHHRKEHIDRIKRKIKVKSALLKICFTF